MAVFKYQTLHTVICKVYVVNHTVLDLSVHVLCD